jgi:hypothetical protein
MTYGFQTRFFDEHRRGSQYWRDPLMVSRR